MLKAVEASTLRNHLKLVLNEVAERKDYMLILRKAKPVGALVNLDFLEDLLALTSSEYLKSVRQARADCKAGRILSHAEVFGKVE